MAKSRQVRVGEILEYNFITAVPAGASETGTIDLPPGYYRIEVYGTQTAATTDPTLFIKRFANAAQTEVDALWGALTTDTAFTPVAQDLELGQTAIFIDYVTHTVSATGTKFPASMYIPHGLQYIYTKNGGTAVDLTLVAIRVA